MTPVFRRFYDERRRLLAGLAIVLAVNVVYRVLGAPRIEARLLSAEEAYLESDVELAEETKNFGRVGLLSSLLAGAQIQIGELRRDILMTRGERFATVDMKIKELAANFGLEARSVSLSYELLHLEQLQRLTVSFSLKGSYRDLRQFLSEIEQAQDAEQRDLFFAVERVSLSDSSNKGKELQMTVQVATYFHEEELTGQRRNRRGRR